MLLSGFPSKACVQLEDSLKNAASSSLKLTPEKRGAFDNVVLEQLAGAFCKLLEAPSDSV